MREVVGRVLGHHVGAKVHFDLSLVVLFQSCMPPRARCTRRADPAKPRETPCTSADAAVRLRRHEEPTRTAVCGRCQSDPLAPQPGYSLARARPADATTRKSARIAVYAGSLMLDPPFAGSSRNISFLTRITRRRPLPLRPRSV